MFNEICKFACEISKEAGVLLKNALGSEDVQIDYKSRTNLVTNMDRESEKLLVSRIRLKYPEHTVIAEEGSRHETDSDFIWYVDPLDATNNYAHGIPFFCVTMGVFSKKENRVIVGVVYEPLRDELFYAIRGQGAWLNDSKITVSKTTSIGISVIATGFPYLKEDPERNNLKPFNRVLPKVQGVRRLGSAALDLSYVACGRFDGYWEPELHPWDMAGGSLIVEEAGGAVTSYTGGLFDPEVPQIVASNGVIHKELCLLITEKTD